MSAMRDIMDLNVNPANVGWVFLSAWTESTILEPVYASTILPVEILNVNSF